MSERVVRIAMVAGEASGDTLGSHLIQALRARLPNARFVGIGGPKMCGQGFEAWHPLEKLAVNGLVEVLKHYRELAGIRADLRRRLLADPPDVFVGIDAPDFNLGLEKALKDRGIPTVHYVSPTIWFWRGKRVHQIGAAASRVLALFPFEPPLYEKHGIPASYVGHPLADELPLDDQRAAARELLGLAPARPVFAVLPGSRQSEIRFMAPTFIGAIRELHRLHSDALFLVPLATRETRLLFEEALYRCNAGDLPIRMLFGHAHDAMAAADVVLVTSGTATLEAALLKRPMVIAYKLAPLTHWLAKRMTYLPYVGLPNILAGDFVVPEFIQHDATPENLAQAMHNLYLDKESGARLGLLFRGLHETLRQNTAEKAAGAVIECMRARTTGHALAVA